MQKSAENSMSERLRFTEYPLRYEGFLRSGIETVILVVKITPRQFSGDSHADNYKIAAAHFYYDNISDY